MPLLDDILTWSLTLPDWQRDALRRLFQGQGRLTPADLVEIRAMVEGTMVAATPVPLEKAHIPTLGAGTSTVLTGLIDLHDVNGFPPGRGLALAATGISVVFGENGAGKSGFARVMKRACRARHSSPVLANAFSKGTVGTPKATLSFTSNGTPTTSQWTEGIATNTDLAGVSVYDSHCAQDYISKDGPCAFLPYGLNVLGALGTAQATIQHAVDQELKSIRLDRQQFAALAGPHAVGQHIDKLGAQSDLTALKSLGRFNDTEVARIAELEVSLKSMDVEPASRAAETLAQRLDGLVAAAGLAERISSDGALDRFAAMAQAESVARDADRFAQAQLRGENKPLAGDERPLLDGTGGDAWKILFQAAEAYSRKAYPEHTEHPAHGNGDQCVLCQQPLAPDAQGRMERFRAFVAAAASKNLIHAKEELSTAFSLVRDTNLKPVDAPTLAEIRERDPSLAASAEAQQNVWLERRRWIIDSYTFGNWAAARPALPDGDLLSTQLTAKARALRTWATEHRRTKDPKQQAMLQAELAGLLARQQLGAHLAAIELYVADAKLQAHLTAVNTVLSTQKISLKVTALAKVHVTQALADALNEELKALGYKRAVKPKVTSQTREGTNIVGLALEDCDRDAKDVLSEGEQRAIGLAFFLAEARLRGDLSTLVFDDPSTSLDHLHRRKIAEHLVKLSTKRPVVVLTHDAVFLASLLGEIAERQAIAKIQTVEWSGGNPGSVQDGLAWESKPYNDQLKELLATAAQMKATHNPQPNNADKRVMRDAYAHMRGMIERAIREIVLNDTVHPFSDEVKVIQVGAVAGFTIEEWRAIVTVYGKASEVIVGHDSPSQGQYEMPSPQDYEKDLGDIEVVIKACEARRSAFNKGEKQRIMDLRSKIRKS